MLEFDPKNPESGDDKPESDLPLPDPSTFSPEDAEKFFGKQAREEESQSGEAFVSIQAPNAESPVEQEDTSAWESPTQDDSAPSDIFAANPDDSPVQQSASTLPPPVNDAPPPSRSSLPPPVNDAPPPAKPSTSTTPESASKPVESTPPQATEASTSSESTTPVSAETSSQTSPQDSQAADSQAISPEAQVKDSQASTAQTTATPQDNVQATQTTTAQTAPISQDKSQDAQSTTPQTTATSQVKDAQASTPTNASQNQVKDSQAATSSTTAPTTQDKSKDAQSTTSQTASTPQDKSKDGQTATSSTTAPTTQDKLKDTQSTTPQTASSTSQDKSKDSQAATSSTTAPTTQDKSKDAQSTTSQTASTPQDKSKDGQTATSSTTVPTTQDKSKDGQSTPSQTASTLQDKSKDSQAATSSTTTPTTQDKSKDPQSTPSPSTSQDKSKDGQAATSSTTVPTTQDKSKDAQSTTSSTTASSTSQDKSKDSQAATSSTTTPTTQDKSKDAQSTPSQTASTSQDKSKDGQAATSSTTAPTTQDKSKDSQTATSSTTVPTTQDKSKDSQVSESEKLDLPADSTREGQPETSQVENTEVEVPLAETTVSDELVEPQEGALDETAVSDLPEPILDEATPSDLPEPTVDEAQPSELPEPTVDEAIPSDLPETVSDEIEPSDLPEPSVDEPEFTPIADDFPTATTTRRPRRNAITESSDEELLPEASRARTLEPIIPINTLTPEQVEIAPIFWRWGDMLWVIAAFLSVMFLQAQGFQAPDTLRTILALVTTSLLTLGSIGFLLWAILTYVEKRRARRLQGEPMRLFFMAQNALWLIVMVLTIVGLSLTDQTAARVIVFIVCSFVIIWWVVKLVIRIWQRHLLRSYDMISNVALFVGIFFAFVFTLIAAGILTGSGVSRGNVLAVNQAYGSLNIIAIVMAILFSLVFLVVIIPEQLRYADSTNRFKGIIEFLGNFLAGNTLETSGLALGVALAVKESAGLGLAANILTAIGLLLIPYGILDKVRTARTKTGYEEAYQVVLIILSLMIALASALNFGFALVAANVPNAIISLIAGGLAIISTVMEIVELAVTGGEGGLWKRISNLIANILLIVATLMAILSAASTFNNALNNGNIAFAAIGLSLFVLAFLLKFAVEIDLLTRIVDLIYWLQARFGSLFGRGAAPQVAVTDTGTDEVVPTN